MATDLVGRLRQLADEVEAFQAAVSTPSGETGDDDPADIAESRDAESRDAELNDAELSVDWAPTPAPAPWLAPRLGRRELESHVA